MVRCALTVAGSDPSGGSGIQADIRTFSSLGVKGLSVIACMTAQNGGAVLATRKVPAGFIDAQFASVAGGSVHAAKTGMLLDEETVISVCRNIRNFSIRNVVADPVIRSSSGTRLLSDRGIDALKSELLPLCEFATPNSEEARVLCGIEIRNARDMETAAREIAEMGVKKVVITGGHLCRDESEVNDLLFDGGKFFRISHERVGSGEVRGTGCVFSSALCALIAKGKTDAEAVRGAGLFTMGMIRNSEEQQSWPKGFS